MGEGWVSNGGAMKKGGEAIQTGVVGGREEKRNPSKTYPNMYVTDSARSVTRPTSAKLDTINHISKEAYP